MVSHGYPPWGLAGVERVTQQTAVALSEMGHDVTVLARKVTPAPPLPHMERPRHVNGVRVAMVGGSREQHGGPFPAHQDRMERIFEQLLLESLPDVVVLGHLFAHSPGYVQVAHRWRIPVVLELHDFYTICERAHLERTSGELCDGPDGGRACARHCFVEEDAAAGRWALRTHLFNLALGHADAIVCPSQFVADYFHMHGVEPKRMHVIPNGIAFPERPASKAKAARSPEEPLHLASLGVATPHKGQHIVVEALRIARLPAVRYTLFGALTQPYTRDLRETADRNAGVELHTFGPYEPTLLPVLLANVDAVIVPSLVWETFSIVAREALACGVPVIASRIGALPEAVREGENGLLFTPGAHAELAVLLQRLHADRAVLRRLRSGIRGTDWITVAERARQLEAVLDDVYTTTPRWSKRETGQPDLTALRTLLAARE